MCDTRGHEHWCSACSKNLNKVPKDSYIEIEWRQNDKGQIIEEKSMICKQCMEDMENVKELTDFFKNLEYPPWNHVFCSECKKDLTKELGRDIQPGKDYECFNFKRHEKSGPSIKHIIRQVVLCQDCVKKEFNTENIVKLKKLGRNPIFKPRIECPNTDICKAFKYGDEKVNCKNIVIGRDRETLHFGLLCGRRHKGCQLLPFDDGFTIARPRKGKGAAVAVSPVVASVPGINPVQDYIKEIEKLFSRHKLGIFSETAKDGVNNNRFLAMEKRMEIIERVLGINSGVIDHQAATKIYSIRGESSGINPNSGKFESIPVEPIHKDDNGASKNINKRPEKYDITDSSYND